MLPCGRTDGRTNKQTSENRATQSLDSVRLSFAIFGRESGTLLAPSFSLKMSVEVLNKQVDEDLDLKVNLDEEVDKAVDEDLDKKVDGEAGD